MRRSYHKMRVQRLLPLARKVTIAAIVTVAVGRALAVPSPGNQTVISLDPSFYAAGPRLKLDNGFLLTWAPSSDASRDAQVKAFDQHGTETMSLNLLQSLPDAKKIAISDVSVSPSGLVAVGAQVFIDESTSKLELLILNSSGQLYKSIDFDQGLGVSKVEIDDDEHIWVLRMGAGLADPAKVPVLTEYDRDGNAMGKFLHFSEFTKDAKIIHGGLRLSGDLQMGVSETQVWFWLPSSHELMTMNQDGTALQKVTTSLPPPPSSAPSSPAPRAEACGWMSSEGFLCQVTFLAKASPNGQNQTGLYLFASESNEWRLMPQEGEALIPHTFLGLDQNNAVFITFDPDQHSIALTSAPLAP
jgi:hypothetical protein